MKRAERCSERQQEVKDPRAEQRGKAGARGHFLRVRCEISWAIRWKKSVPGQHNPSQALSLQELAEDGRLPGRLLIAQADTRGHFAHTFLDTGGWELEQSIKAHLSRSQAARPTSAELAGGGWRRSAKVSESSMSPLNYWCLVVSVAPAGHCCLSECVIALWRGLVSLRSSEVSRLDGYGCERSARLQK